LAGEAKRSMSPISEATAKALIHPNPGALTSSGM
jgi:hypothetical protein